MSNISKQKALEAYPRAYYRNGGGIDDANASDRAVYEEGYDQAIQDFMDKACEYLRMEFVDMGLRYIRGCAVDDEIKMFKKYMQDESKSSTNLTTCEGSETNS